MTTIVGLDTAIKAAGVAIIRHHDDTTTATTHVVGSKGRASDTLAQQARNLTQRRNQILDLIPRDTDLIVIEAPALRLANPGTDRLHALWWFTIAALGQVVPDAHITKIFPGTLKKFTQGGIKGGGNATKTEQEQAIARMWPGVFVKDDNAADALAAASAGAVHMRVPVPFTITEDRRLSIASTDKLKLDWPARPERTR